MADAKDFAAQREFKERERISARSSLVSAARSFVHLWENVACTHNNIIRILFYIYISLTTSSQFQPRIALLANCENISRRIIIFKLFNREVFNPKPLTMIFPLYYKIYNII